jgi:hypothetical protein
LNPLLIIGRVPLFFFMLHFTLAHLLAFPFALVRYGHAEFIAGALPSMGGAARATCSRLAMPATSDARIRSGSAITLTGTRQRAIRSSSRSLSRVSRPVQTVQVSSTNHARRICFRSHKAAALDAVTIYAGTERIHISAWSKDSGGRCRLRIAF